MTTNTRTCDGCTKCCEGWLHGSAQGHAFYPGKPCHFLGKGCSIYADRPEDPCKKYQCEWLASDELPMWMRPDLCKVIVTKRIINGVEFYDVLEAGQLLDAKVLSWFVLWALNTKKNLLYSVDGGRNRVGSDAFLQLKL
jgi:hypothetical protein